MPEGHITNIDVLTSRLGSTRKIERIEVVAYPLPIVVEGLPAVRATFQTNDNVLLHVESAPNVQLFRPANGKLIKSVRI